jgi:nucleoside-diphosphate kinase
MERTLVLLKPDALARGLIGEITATFERKGLLLVGCKMLQLDPDVVRQHYAHLAHEPYFESIVNFMTRSPIIAQCWAGVEAIAVVRAMTGDTNGRRAAAGTLRGNFAMSVQCNLLHASDSAGTAAVELRRFFGNGELFSYDVPGLRSHYAPDETGEPR